jgi:uncharacterized protein
VNQKFLPHRVAIEFFGNGGFRLAGGYSHLGSLLILPSGMRAFAPSRFGEISENDVEPIVAEKADIDFALIGTGPKRERLSTALLNLFRSHAITVDAMSTSTAVSTYNVMLAENRRVAACLIAVDRAHDR